MMVTGTGGGAGPRSGSDTGVGMASGSVEPGIVLVVEDDVDLRSFLELALRRRATRTIRTAADPQEALAILAGEAVDVLVTDLQMPGMTGLELIERVRGDHPDLPVIMMTAHGTMEHAVQALRHHVDEFLVKPLSAATLIPTVARLAEKGLAARRAAQIISTVEQEAAADEPAADRLALRGLAAALGRQVGIEDGLARAAEVQRSLLPRAAPQVAGFDFAGVCLPSNAVGGDFFDWMVDDGRVRFTVADVMGKGVAAALLTAAVRAVLRSTTAPDGPAGTVRLAAERLHDDLDAAGSFVTLFHGELRTADADVHFVDAGHGLGLLVRQDGRHEQLHGVDLPLGVVRASGWTADSRRLEPGDRLVVVSDGVLDLWDDGDAALPELARVVAAAQDCADVVARVARLTRDSPPADDVTMVVIGRDLER